MGATCWQSLYACLQPASVNLANGGPGSGTNGSQGTAPDGALPPGPAKTLAMITDGTAHTIMCVETMDFIQFGNANPGGNYGPGGESRWLFATDCTLVGLPTTGYTPVGGGSTVATYGNGSIGTAPTLNTPQTVGGAVEFQSTQTTGGFWAPINWENNGDGGTYSPQNTTGMYPIFRTFLGFDFLKKDRLSYPVFSDDESYSGYFYNAPEFGPSAAHPSVVNHLFVDGSVRSIDKSIDVATYMFLITRAGGDPFALTGL